MPRCFVVQPFTEKYQKLYNDVYKGAIEDAGVEPYKVDEDPSVSIPIEAIEKQIAESDFCFADISEDNPNVWYELGYAMAAGKGACIVCAKQVREQLPFDVRHRNVIFYDSESISDFLGLKEKITKRLSTLESKSKIVKASVADKPLQANGDNLEPYELSVLGFIAAEQSEVQGSARIFSVKTSLSNAGYRDVAFALAFQKFESEGLVEAFTEEDYDGYVRACRLTDSGWVVLRSQRANLEIIKSAGKTKTMDFSKDFDDEIPF